MVSKQLNQETWERQNEIWHELILDFCKTAKVFEIDLENIESTKTGHLFHNASIKRRLKPAVAQEIIQGLVQKGEAEWKTKQKTKCYIYCKKIEEWSKLIYNWAKGLELVGTVCTMYEILHGDYSINEDFHNMDPVIFKKALDTLQKEGKAIMFSSLGGDEAQLGVKFL